MAFPADLIRTAYATADKLTDGMQVPVIHEAWTGEATDGYRGKGYAAKATHKAHVIQGAIPFRTSGGETITVAAIVNFLRPIGPNGAPGRAEPLDPRDKLTLPDGTEGPPIVGAKGMVDPSTNRPYALTVAVGRNP